MPRIPVNGTDFFVFALVCVLMWVLSFLKKSNLLYCRFDLSEVCTFLFEVRTVLLTLPVGHAVLSSTLIYYRVMWTPAV